MIQFSSILKLEISSNKYGKYGKVKFMWSNWWITKSNNWNLNR